MDKKQEKFEQMSLFEILGITGNTGKNMSSEEMSAFIDKLWKARAYTIKREKEEKSARKRKRKKED